MAKQITNSDDVIDSRDVIERIAELQADIEENEHTDEEKVELQQELDVLVKLADQGESLADWEYGETLVRESYFEQYAQELADDLGYTSKDVQWPHTCIDWEQAARELQQDYTPIDFDGVTYYAHS